MELKDQLKRDRDDIQWVIATEQGRRFMWRLLSYCKVHHDIGGPHESVYKDLGKRNVGLFLEGIIADASEDRLFEMMREAKNRSIEEKEDYDRANKRNETDSRTISTVAGLISEDRDYHTGGLPGHSTFGGAIF